MEFAEVRKRATLPTRSVSLCLAGELSGELQRLERDLAQTRAATDIGDGTRRQLGEQIDVVKQEMRDSTVEFKLRAIPARQWGLFWAELPTRDEKESDKDWEDRIHPFHVELVSRTVSEPAMTTDEAAELAGTVHMAAWVALINECYTVNRTTVDVPNFGAASESTGSSEPT